MALRLLLDAHISSAVARGLRAHGADAVAITEWHGGRYRSAADPDVLRVAHLEQRTLVSYDLSSIPDLLRELAEAGEDHSGVIFVSQKTIREGDTAGLVEALLRAPFR